jgi:hypothetical protein
VSAADYVVAVVCVLLVLAGVGYPLWFQLYQWWDLRRRKRQQTEQMGRLLSQLLGRGARGPVVDQHEPDHPSLHGLRTRNRGLGSDA